MNDFIAYGIGLLIIGVGHLGFSIFMLFFCKKDGIPESLIMCFLSLMIVGLSIFAFVRGNQNYNNYDTCSVEDNQNITIEYDDFISFDDI